MSGPGDKKLTYRNLPQTPRPEDSLRSTWVSPRGTSTNHRFEGLAEPLYAVQCSPDGRMEWVSLLPSAQTEAVRRSTAVSPTGKYVRPTEAQSLWRGEVPKEGRRLHDRQCQGIAPQMSEALRPLREAVDEGQVRAVPLGSALLDPAGYERLVAEYGFYVGQERLAEKQQGRPETQVATIALTRGGWHYTGVDIDRNGRLDVLMAESANQIFFIYDLERMPADKTLGLGRERLVVNPSGLTACRGKFSGAYVIQRPPPEPTAPTPVPPPWWAASPEGFLTLNQTCSPVSQIEVGFYPLALVRSGAGLPPRLRADATKPEVEEWVGRTTDFTLRVPAPISKAYELPPLPEGYAWSANSMSLQQIHWTSSTEGEILFSLDYHHQDRPFFASGQYRFRIPFNLTAPQTICLGDAIQSGSPSR